MGVRVSADKPHQSKTKNEGDNASHAGAHRERLSNPTSTMNDDKQQFPRSSKTVESTQSHAIREISGPTSYDGGEELPRVEQHEPVVPPQPGKRNASSSRVPVSQPQSTKKKGKPNAELKSQNRSSNSLLSKASSGHRVPQAMTAVRGAPTPSSTQQDTSVSKGNRSTQLSLGKGNSDASIVPLHAPSPTYGSSAVASPERIGSPKTDQATVPHHPEHVQLKTAPASVCQRPNVVANQTLEPTPNGHLPPPFHETEPSDTLPSSGRRRSSKSSSSANRFTNDRIAGERHSAILEDEKYVSGFNGRPAEGGHLAATHNSMDHSSNSLNHHGKTSEQTLETPRVFPEVPSLRIEDEEYPSLPHQGFNGRTPIINTLLAVDKLAPPEMVGRRSYPVDNTRLQEAGNRVNVLPVVQNYEMKSVDGRVGQRRYVKPAVSRPAPYVGFAEEQFAPEKGRRLSDESGNQPTDYHTVDLRYGSEHSPLSNVPSKRRFSGTRWSRSANRYASDQRSAPSQGSVFSSPLRVVVDHTKDKSMHLAMTIGQRTSSFPRFSMTSQSSLRTSRRDQGVVWTMDPTIVQKHRGELTNYILELPGANVLRHIPLSRRQDVSLPLVLQYASIATAPQFITPLFLHQCFSELKYVGLPLKGRSADALTADLLTENPFFDAQEVIDKARDYLALLVDSSIVATALDAEKRTNVRALLATLDPPTKQDMSEQDEKAFFDSKLKGYCDNLIKTCINRFTCNVGETLALGVDYAITKQKLVKSFAFAHKQCERIYEVYRCNSRNDQEEDNMIKCTLHLAARLRRSEVVGLFVMPSVLNPAVAYSMVQSLEKGPMLSSPIDMTTVTQPNTLPFFGSEFCATYVSAAEESIARCFTALFISALTEYDVFLEDPTSMLRFGVRKAAQKTFEIIQKQRYAYEEAKVKQADALAKEAVQVVDPSVAVTQLWDAQKDVAFVEPELDVGIVYVRKNRLYCTYTRSVVAYLFMCSDSSKIQCLPVSDVYDNDRDEKGSKAIGEAIATHAAVEEKNEFEFLHAEPLQLSKCSVTLPTASKLSAAKVEDLSVLREPSTRTKENIQAVLEKLSVSLPNVAITSSRRYFDKSTLYYQFVLIRTMLLLDLYAAHTTTNKNRHFLARKMVERVRLDRKMEKECLRIHRELRRRERASGSNHAYSSDGSSSSYTESLDDYSSSSDSFSESCTSSQAGEFSEDQSGSKDIDFHLCHKDDADEFEDELCYDPLCLDPLVVDRKTHLCDHYGWKAVPTHLPLKDTASIWDSSTDEEVESRSDARSENTFDSDRLDAHRRGASRTAERGSVKRAQRGQTSPRGRLQRRLSDRLSASHRNLLRSSGNSHPFVHAASADLIVAERTESSDLKMSSAILSVQEKVDDWKQDLCKDMVGRYREERERGRKERERPLFRRERRALRRVVDAALLSSLKVGASEAERERIDHNPSAVFAGTKARRRMERELKRQHRMQMAAGASATPPSQGSASPKSQQLQPKPPTPLAGSKLSFSSSRRRLNSGDAAAEMSYSVATSSDGSPLRRDDEEREHLVPFDLHLPTPKKVSPFSNSAKLMGSGLRGSRGSQAPVGGSRRPLPRSGTLPKPSSFKKNRFGKAAAPKQDAKKPAPAPTAIEWTQDTRKRLCAFLAQRIVFHWYQAQAVMERSATERTVTSCVNTITTQEKMYRIAGSISSKQEQLRLTKEKRFFIQRRKNALRRRYESQQVFASRMQEHYAAAKRSVSNAYSCRVDAKVDVAIRDFFAPHTHTRRLAPRAPWRVLMDKRIFMRYICMADDLSGVASAHSEVAKKLLEPSDKLEGMPCAAARDYAFEMQSVADVMTTVLKLEMMKRNPQRNPHRCTVSALIIPQYVPKDDIVTIKPKDQNKPNTHRPQTPAYNKYETAR